MALSLVQEITIYVLPVLFAITLHEVAHGWVASKFGDQTARLAGRLTLNPFKHVDLVGTVIVPIMMLVFTGFMFGWAKPVPVDARNLRNPRRDMAFVAAAGPIANIVMAILWAGMAKLCLIFLSDNAWIGVPLVLMGKAGVMINVVLAVLNCLPIPPLDGGRVLVSLLPPRMAWTVARIEPYSFWILVLLMVTNLLSYILFPPIIILIQLISNVFGLP